MKLFSLIFLTFTLFACILTLANGNCGARYGGFGLCKMLISKVVFVPNENKCQWVRIPGCSSYGTFFRSIRACEAKCVR
ncbi:uncharacterized protein LOC108033548 [Drosophila biarmipes]|uniref:uncharacterized protein LOC108033548 n=1 Tax=Drosophila biarmipes TaxID=125945 RepID=UPI0007E71FBC|nr:uncharacterized protein LOC108033548 [Drosophila biarmipes]